MRIKLYDISKMSKILGFLAKNQKLIFAGIIKNIKYEEKGVII